MKAASEGGHSVALCFDGEATSAYVCGNLEYSVDDERVRSAGRNFFWKFNRNFEVMENQ